MEEESEKKNTIFSNNEEMNKLSLSPIIEMDESSLIGNSLLEEQGEEIAEHLHDDAKQSEIMLYMATSATSTECNTTIENRFCPIQPPVTPPEVLRERLSVLKSENEHLSQEYEELKEFTALEKQELHSDCYPIDDARSLQEEFNSVNDKVEHLMQENLGLKNKLVVKDNEVKELDIKLSEVTKSQLAFERVMLKTIHKLREDSMDEASDSINNLLLEPAKNDKSETALKPNFKFSSSEEIIEDFKNLIEQCIFDRIESQTKVEMLYSDNKELKEINEQLNERISELDQNLIEIKNGMLQLQEGLVYVEEEKEHLASALSISENQLKCLNEKNEELKCEIAKLCCDTQVKINLLLKRLGKLFDSWCQGNDEINTNLELEEISNLFNLSHGLFNPEIKSSIFLLLSKLENKIKFNINENTRHCLKIEELDNKISHFEDESNALKMTIQDIEHEIKNQLGQRLAELESVWIENENEKKELQDLYLKENVDKRQILNSLSKLENLLKITEMENSKLKNEIEQFKNVETARSLQNNIAVILVEFEKMINLWNEDTKFDDLIIYVKENEYLKSLIKTILDSETQEVMFRLLSCINKKLVVKDEENYQFQMIGMNLKSSVEVVEYENNNLKKELFALKRQVKQDLIDKIEKLENVFSNIVLENEELLIKNSLIEKENLELTSALDDAKTKIKCTENLLELMSKEKFKLQKEIKNNQIANKPDDLNEIILLILNELNSIFDFSDSNTSIDNLFSTLQRIGISHKVERFLGSKSQAVFSDVIRKIKKRFVHYGEDKPLELEDVKKNSNTKNLDNTNPIIPESRLSVDIGCCNKLEELVLLKELIISEITALDSGENKLSLEFSTSEEIFRKLMEIIMQKESDFQKILKADLENAEKTLENMSKKLKSQESWITVIEADNEKLNKELSQVKAVKITLECQVKTLSSDAKVKSDEINSLKSKILELTTENDLINNDINKCNEIIEKQKIIFSFEDCAKSFDEVDKRTQVISKLPLLEKQEKSLNLEKSINVDGKQELNIFDSGMGDHLSHPLKDFGTIAVNLNFKDSNINKLHNSHVEGFIPSSLMNELVKDKSLVVEMLTNHVNNADLSEILFSCTNNLTVLKDIFLVISKKVSDFEAWKMNELKLKQDEVDFKTKEINDLRSTLTEFHNEFVPDSNSFYEEVSLKNELDSAKEECLHINGDLEDFKKRSKTGMRIMQNLRKQFFLINEDNFKKSKLVKNLTKTVQLKQKTIEKMKEEYKIMTNQINCLKNKKLFLENLFHKVQVKISNIMQIINAHPNTTVYPLQIENLDHEINYIMEIIEKKFQENNVALKSTEELAFFASQLELMLEYIRSIESKLFSAQEENKHSTIEISSLKENLSLTNNNLLQANILLNDLLSKSLLKIPSLNQAVGVLNNIFSQYSLSKEIESKIYEESKMTSENLFQKIDELNSLKKLNSSLKSELENCQDVIRNLRSELRSTRLQYQKLRNSSRKLSQANEIGETGIQTDNLCCSKLEGEILEQNRTMAALKSNVTSLEMKFQKESNRYKKKVHYLEEALFQSKEKIKTLRAKMIQQENYCKELLETHKSHDSCEEKLEA